MISFETSPDRYQHWRLAFEGEIATLLLDADEDGGLQPGYRLKLNSYDLGVDIELNDALQRIRFEHPSVRCVVITSAKQRMFCSGANIYMLGSSSHAWKVNFCKFTNETRNSIEDTSAHCGLKFLAALNGAAAGGGYELALACDEIVMIDDRSSTVSLPEVPLLAVLPGTGGLTRLVDKRKVRRDLADVFCTTSEGVRAARALEWKLVDAIAAPDKFAALIESRARALGASSARPANAVGIRLPPLQRRIDDAGLHYQWVDVTLERGERTATFVVTGPDAGQPRDLEAIHAAGAAWWPLAMARELDDAILHLRTNENDLGTWVLKTRGDLQAMLDCDAAMLAQRDDWLVRETIAMLRRTFSRLDVSSRTMFALIDQGSCFGGTLFELALAADRSYMLVVAEGESVIPRVALSEVNYGALTMANDSTRLATHFSADPGPLTPLEPLRGKMLDAEAARDLGLVTLTPDELDWDDEIRLALEERSSLSPDALSGMEASLRFPGKETLATKIFGRLSAWQNWIFTRPNAIGEHGALKIFGSGSKAKFNWERI
jgi:benzoyl-CoA-dihydrodiol lyase